MSKDLVQSVPAQVVVAKRNKEKLAAQGVTEEKIFFTIKKALNALKPETGKRGPSGERAEKRIPDWQTRLKAVELYITLTQISPEDVSKSLKGVTIEVAGDSLPEVPEGVPIESDREKRHLLDSYRALAAGKEPPPCPDEPLVLPPKTNLSLKEVLEQRRREISERMAGKPGSTGFTPTTPLKESDI